MPNALAYQNGVESFPIFEANNFIWVPICGINEIKYTVCNEPAHKHTHTQSKNTYIDILKWNVDNQCEYAAGEMIIESNQANQITLTQFLTHTHTYTHKEEKKEFMAVKLWSGNYRVRDILRIVYTVKREWVWESNSKIDWEWKTYTFVSISICVWEPLAVCWMMVD